MKNKKYLLALVALLAVAAVLLGVYFLTRPDAQQGDKSVTVTVVHGDGTEKTFSYHTDAQMLGTLLQQEQLVQGTPGEYGLYIETVDGETADYSRDGSYWALYIGGEYAMTSADQTPLHDGDRFRLVYTVEQDAK